MADHDVINSPAPKRRNNRVVKPTIAELRAALTAHSATSYSAARLNAMTRNDMLNAARVHSLTVNTTL